MLSGLDLWAILAGIGAMVGASVAGGVLLSFGMISDAVKGASDSSDPRSASFEDDVEARMEAGLVDRSTLIQLVILSWGATMLGGALTASMAGHAPIINALIVGLASFAGAFLPAGPIPRRIMIVAGIVAVPAALLGAAIVT